jgi:hypothetical protein
MVMGRGTFTGYLVRLSVERHWNRDMTSIVELGMRGRNSNFGPT